MNGQIEVIPTERNVTETFHCRGTESSALLAHIRDEDAVLLNRSVECVSEHLTLKEDKN